MLKIITGVGRCGTSVLAEYCRLIGLDIGHVKWITEYDAGNEDLNTVRINQSIIKKGINPNIENQIKGVTCDVVKDPRFLVKPEIIKHWNKHHDIEVIFLTRKYVDIIASQKRKATMNTPAYRCFADLIGKHELQFMQILAKEKIKFTSLRFPEFLKEYKKVQSIFGGDYETWNKLIK